MDIEVIEDSDEQKFKAQMEKEERTRQAARMDVLDDPHRSFHRAIHARSHHFVPVTGELYAGLDRLEQLLASSY
jgi:hypothetical protein